MQKNRPAIPITSIKEYIDGFVKECFEHNDRNNTVYMAAKEAFCRENPKWEIENPGATFAFWMRNKQKELNNPKGLIPAMKALATKEYTRRAVEDLMKYTLDLGMRTYDALMEDFYEEELRFYSNDTTHLDCLLKKVDVLIEQKWKVDNERNTEEFKGALTDEFDEAGAVTTDVLPWDRDDAIKKAAKKSGLSELEQEMSEIDNYRIRE